MARLNPNQALQKTSLASGEPPGVGGRGGGPCGAGGTPQLHTWWPWALGRRPQHAACFADAVPAAADDGEPGDRQGPGGDRILPGGAELRGPAPRPYRAAAEPQPAPGPTPPRPARHCRPLCRTHPAQAFGVPVLSCSRLVGGGRRADPSPRAALAVPGRWVVPGQGASGSGWVPRRCRGSGALTLAVAQLQRKMEERRLRLQEAANR